MKVSKADNPQEKTTRITGRSTCCLYYIYIYTICWLKSQMEKANFISQVVSTMDKIASHKREVNTLSTYCKGFPIFESESTQEELTGHVLFLESLVGQSEIILKDLNAEKATLSKKLQYFMRKVSQAQKLEWSIKRYSFQDEIDTRLPKIQADHKIWCEKAEATRQAEREVEGALDRLPKLILNAQAVITRHAPQTVEFPTIDYTQDFRNLVGEHAETLFDSTVDRLRCGLMTTANALNYMRGRLQLRDLTSIMEDLDEVLEEKWEQFFEWLESTDKTDFLTLRSLYVDVLHEVVG